MQILDQNFHSTVLASLDEREKRGRPDVVHLALLDAASTPLFQDGRLRLLLRTRQGFAIEVKTGTRLPRTLQRFCGVMAKLLSGRYGAEEERLFRVEKNQSFGTLIKAERVDKVISFSTLGSSYVLRDLIASEIIVNQNTAWVIGGFGHGHFQRDVTELSDLVVSVSDRALPAHVVSARICYELEFHSKN
jgi:rRNA small subunit pseudouridine methyltransferase Nep1